MTDVPPPPGSLGGDGPHRRGGLGPLLAITVLVLLLSAFLVIRWQRRDAGPAVVKEAPRPSPIPASSAVVEPGPPAQKDPREEPYAAAVKDAEEAIAAKHWDDAEKAIKKARDYFDRPKLKELEERVRVEREADTAAAKAAAEERKKQEVAWSETQRRVNEELRPKSFYDEALAALEKLEKDFPKMLQDQRFVDLRKTIQDLFDGADKHYRQLMADAEKAFAEERYTEALHNSRQAATTLPGRQAAVRAFQDKVNEAIQRKLMVRIVCNQPCTIGGEASEEEKPVRTVKLEPFFIDKHKVTNEDYFAFVTATNHPMPAHWKWTDKEGRPRRGIPPGKEKHPVTFVTYADAEAYAAWAGKRLPTAEEWEVAARGPDAREYPWGNAFAEKENVFRCNCVEYWQLNKNPPSTLAVDAFDAANSASFHGVYGMGGNVWEWTSSKKVRQVNGKPEEFRLLKGGSFMTGARAIRSANALPEDPTLALPDVGFRCVRDVK